MTAVPFVTNLRRGVNEAIWLPVVLMRFCFPPISEGPTRKWSFLYDRSVE
jgi:hypothetical protein